MFLSLSPARNRRRPAPSSTTFVCALYLSLLLLLLCGGPGGLLVAEGLRQLDAESALAEVDAGILPSKAAGRRLLLAGALAPTLCVRGFVPHQVHRGLALTNPNWPIAFPGGGIAAPEGGLFSPVGVPEQRLSVPEHARAGTFADAPGIGHNAGGSSRGAGATGLAFMPRGAPASQAQSSGAQPARPQGWTFVRPSPTLFAASSKQESSERVGPHCAVDMEPIDQISEGKFGQVWKVHLRSNNLDKVVAVKIVSRTARNTARVLREVQLLEMFADLPDFVEYLGWWESSGGKEDEMQLMIITELADGDLQSLVVDQDFDRVDFKTRVRLFQQLLSGLRIMETKGIVHRDIKPQNLLLTSTSQDAQTGERKGKKEYHLKIADFGYSCSMPGGASHLCLSEAESKHLSGTYEYFAPESWMSTWSPKMDVWAAGLVLYEMVFEGNMPLLNRESKLKYDVDTDEGKAEFLTQWRGFDILGDRRFLLARDLAELEEDRGFFDLLNLMAGMLERDPERRLSANEAYKIVARLNFGALNPKLSQEIVREVNREIVSGALDPAAASKADAETDSEVSSGTATGSDQEAPSDSDSDYSAYSGEMPREIYKVAKPIAKPAKELARYGI